MFNEDFEGGKARSCRKQQKVKVKKLLWMGKQALQWKLANERNPGGGVLREEGLSSPGRECPMLREISRHKDTLYMYFIGVLYICIGV